LYRQLQQDYKSALKAKDTTAKEILSYVLSQLKNKQIDTQKELDDTTVVKLLQKEIKTRLESIGLLRKANKAAEADLEQAKITVLERYLPEMLDEDALQEIVLTKINEMEIGDLARERGQLIGAIMQQYGTQVDGAKLNQVIQGVLSSSSQ
jgi:hypothetical protein